MTFTKTTNPVFKSLEWLKHLMGDLHKCINNSHRGVIDLHRGLI